MAMDVSSDAALAAKKAQDSELVALKQQVDRLRHDLTPGQTGKQKLRKACNDFEAVFITKMWEQMRATVPKSGLFNSQQEEMYRSMFDRDFAEKLAADGGIGLGDMLYGQLQEKIKNAGQGSSLDAARTAAAGAAAASGAAGKGAKASRPVQTLPGQLPAAEQRATTLVRQAPLAPPRRPLSSNQNAAQPSVAAADTQAQPTAAASVPASVPGAVMADVEALARRIEAGYASRQAASSGQAEAQAVQGVQPVSQGGGQRVRGYSRAGDGDGTGRILAKIS